MNSLRFLFEGQRITDNHTPKEVSILGDQFLILFVVISVLYSFLAIAKEVRLT